MRPMYFSISVHPDLSSILHDDQTLGAKSVLDARRVVCLDVDVNLPASALTANDDSHGVYQSVWRTMCR